MPIQTRWYSSGGELLANGGFENLTGSNGGFALWERPQEHIMSSDAFEGKYALQVGDGKQDRVQVARNLMVEGMRPGTRYRVTCAIKTLKYDRGNGLHFSALSQEGKRYKSHGGVSFAPPKEPGVWKTVSGEFTMQPGATLFRIMFDAFRGGSYLVDAVKFEEKKPDGTYAIARETELGKGEMVRFTEDWIRLYRGEGRKYLAYGRQLHPPAVECDRVPYHENFRGTEIENDKPAVFASAWEADDGSQALCFGNATPVDRTIAYRWNGAWTKMTLKPHELKLVHP